MPELIQDPFEDPAEPFSSALTPEDNSCDAVSKTAPSEAFSIDQWCYCDHHRTVDMQDSQNTEAKNMEPSNQVYPGLLRSLSPNQAVTVLDERLKLIGKVNSDVADWLAERRRVEEAYVQGLRKLASRRPQDASQELGIFRTPWQSIVSSMSSRAESHAALATNLQSDVERPLLEYQLKSREMQAMSSSQGNLAALAKEVDGAHKRAAKLTGGKSSANKVANATSDMEAANQQWNEQAPYVFEQLQRLDLNRAEHLQKVLIQLETMEADLVEKNRVTTESCLNVVLNVDTKDEISTFAARMSGSGSSIPSHLGSQNATSNSSALTSTTAQTPASTPSRARENSAGDAPSSFSTTSSRAYTAPPPKSSSGGLRRLGTLLGGGRSKGSKGMDRPLSPEKRSRPTRNPLRRGTSSRQDMQTIDSPPETSRVDLPSQISRQEAPPTSSGSNERPSSRPEQRRVDLNDPPNGGPTQAAPIRSSSLPMTNGAPVNRDLPAVQEDQYAPPPGPPPGKALINERDTEGYSVPSSAVDDITRAQQEASASDADQPQFKVAIRNEPIQDDDPDAQSAFSSVANALRAQASQAATPRKLGTNRGRRDVRNTVFVPSGQSLESAGLGSAVGLGGVAASSTPPANLGTPATVLAESQRGSDAQSVRSAHSVTSQANPSSATHAPMHRPGLNASIIETLSATFNNTQVTRAVFIGELALQYNPSETAARPGSETVRLENFPVLEKIAPNPSFITQTPSGSGEYSVSLSQVTRPSVAFKYQVHLEESNLAAHCPVSIMLTWKFEPTQASIMLTYAFNPAFVSPMGRRVSLKNVKIFAYIENAKALRCQTKPSGVFDTKERNMVVWKLGDMTLDGYAEAPQKLLARFTTDSEAKPGNIEMNWEISGEAAAGLGSGLGLSQMSSSKEEGGSDPFADESTTSAVGAWREVPLTRKMVSGKYIAN